MRIAFVILSLALLAGVVVGREKPQEMIFEQQRSRQVDLDLARLDSRGSGTPAGDPFAPRSFAAPEQPAAAAAPAAPELPPLPFRYMGKVIEDGKTEFLLLRGDEHLVVSPGQKIDAEYRLDKVSATRLTFTFLPMKTRQTLEITP